jgi:hypothetical protein
MKKTALCSFLLVSFLCQSAFAEDTLPSASPTSVVRPLKTGDISPFDGLLLSPMAIAEIIADKKLLPEKIAAETEKVKQQEQANCNLSLKEKDADKQQYAAIQELKLQNKDAEIEALNKKLSLLQSSQISSTPYIVVGAAAGITTTLLTTFVVYKMIH